MSSQTKLIKDIISLYDTILENKNVYEAVDVYDNVDFKSIGDVPQSVILELIQKNACRVWRNRADGPDENHKPETWFQAFGYQY